MRLSFYIDKPNESRSPILANLAIAGRRYRFGTGVVIEPRLWNAGKQTIKTSDPNFNAHSKRLQAIATYVQRVYNELHPSGKDKLLAQSDIETLVQRIRAFIAPNGGHALKSENTFSGRFQEFIDTYTIRTRTGQITHRRPGATSLSLYARTLRYLMEWSTAKRVALTFECIDESMYQSFCAWLGNEKGHADTSVSNIIKVLKIFMRWSRQKGYHSTSTWELFWRDRRTGDTIALNVDELRRIRDLDLTENPRLARIRDVFLLQAYTGLRYGDLQLLQPKHFDDEVGIIRFTTTKNHTQCIIPITKPLRQLLQLHPTRSFDIPSNVKANLYLKELGKVAGLDKITTVAHYRGGERIEESKPRSELLTTHVARRTFSTTSVRFGVPESVISIVTGHAAKGMLQQHYILFDEEAVRDIVCNAWEQL